MLCDTHTAVALKCALEYMEKQQPAGKMLVVSTASAYKFAPSVLDSLGAQVPEDEFDSIEALMQKTDTRAPPAPSFVKKPESPLQSDDRNGLDGGRGFPIHSVKLTALYRLRRPSAHRFSHTNAPR